MSTKILVVADYQMDGRFLPFFFWYLFFDTSGLPFANWLQLHVPTNTGSKIKQLVIAVHRKLKAQLPQRKIIADELKTCAKMITD